MKGVSEFVIVLIILIIAIASILVVWLFYNSMFGSVVTSEDTSNLGEVLSSCMKIDSVSSNKIYLRNCGTGTVRNDSISVYMDEAPIAFTMNPSSIGKGQVAEIALSGLWGMSFGNHKIRISSKAGEVERYVKAVLPDSCVLDLEFDEGSGNITYDSSGYGNNGAIHENISLTANPDSSGFIRDWLVIGIFSESDCACDSGVCDAFINETSLKYPGLIENGKTWFEHHNSDNFIDLDNEVFPPGADDVVAYAFAVVYSPTTRNVQLKVGSDDGIKAWLNGNLVDDNGYACRGASADQDVIPVTLNQGFNFLLLRVGDAGGGWAFLARFTDGGGNPQTDLNISLDSRPVKWVDGKFGNALQFDGIGDYVNIDYDTSLDVTDFTIEAWIKRATMGSNHPIVDKESGSTGYYFWIESNNKIYAGYGDGSIWNFVFPDTIITENQWYHIVMVKSGLTLYYYVNGILNASQTFADNIVNNSAQVLIGACVCDHFFNGTIDSVRIFNKALTPDETVSLTLGELA